MTFRMARQFGSHIPLTDNRCYRVETEELLTAEEARELMAQLGSPYGSERTPEMKPGPDVYRAPLPEVRIAAVHPEGQIPKQALEHDAGRDLRTIRPIRLDPGEVATYGTGIAIQLPPNLVGMVCPRSGLASKRGVTVHNAPGIIDSGYTGEIKVVLHNAGEYAFEAEPGDRIAQLVIVELPPVRLVEVSAEHLDDTARGAAGFGSTGTR